MEPLVKGRKLVDRYTLVELLHNSEHSQVWLAQDASLRSRVAIKIARGSDHTANRLLQNEHTMCARCAHPGVVRVFDFHDDAAQTLLTVEYLTGGRAGDLIGRPATYFLPVMIELAEALAHVHAQGVVHRDVKLSNVLLDGQGHARLIDFGVASERGEDGLRSGGSPRSMSPQQRGGEPPDPADDLYSFGVALHRLAEGTWPGEAVEARKAGGSLALLIDELLRHDAAQRPSGMSAVAERLRQALSEQSNVTLPPDQFEVDAQRITDRDGDDFDNIQVVTGDNAAVTPPPVETRSRKALGLLAVYGLIGAAALFYFLPKLASEREVTVPAIATDSERATTSDSPRSASSGGQSADAAGVEPWKLAQQAKLRKEAEEVLEALLEQQFFLEDERATVWASDDFEQIKVLAVQGDQAFRRDEFELALTRYEEGKAIADELAARAGTILATTLESAGAQLAAADSTEATRLYQLALDIEPESTAATEGLTRAANLDEVLALVAEGEALEQTGNVNGAKNAFERAVSLDGQWAPARAGIERMARAQARSAYSRHMSAGFAALDRGDFAASQDAFEKAQRLQPQSQEVAAAMTQLDTAIRLKDVNRLRSRAAELERQGDLRGAEREYQAILDQAPSSDTAAAMRRVREHAEVDETLTMLLAKPSRLASDSVYRDAQALLERVDPYMSDPSVSGRVATLRQYMEAAKIPVRVELRSDGKTDVLVYRIGRLGTLTSETLDLRPGQYTVVGTRVGYRDVRINFDLAPGESLAPIEVICRERI